MKKELMIVNIKESVIECWLKDIMQIALVLLAFYLNYKYVGGSVMLQIILTILFFFTLYKMGSKRNKQFTDKESALEHVRKFYEE